MVSQYPYQLWIKQAPDATQDASGNWVSIPAPSWVQISSCRDENNLSGSKISLDDGGVYVYSTLVQLPKTCPVVQVGTQFEVRSGSTVRVAGTVVRFSQDQLHCRLWV